MSAPRPPFAVPSSWLVMPSPNHSARTKPVTAIVLHADAASRVESSLDWIRRRESQVSYHVLIGRDGVVYAVVDPDRKAWHAGVSQLGEEHDCNQFAVGVALSNRNDGIEPYPLAQQNAAADVCARLCAHYGIDPARIVSHAQVAPTRKTDPKEFDMVTFRARVAARLAWPGAAA